CIVLGMGVPTTANYCIMAATCAPILMQLGIPMIAAHFFVFYFGIVADITPPVALAAYAGSAIAKSRPMPTAINASKLAIAAFVVPYVFAFYPVLLGVETPLPLVVFNTATAMVGLMGVAACLNGYLFTRINPLFRILLAVAGVLLIIPELLSDGIGAAVVAVVLLAQLALNRRAKGKGDGGSGEAPRQEPEQA
ncbi:MAG: TRAP transporter large permease subunit, partial [Coriobacteriales bacterium]